MGHSNCDKCGHDTKMCDCPEEINTEHVNDRQVGGSHYRSSYQHWDWSIDMNIGPIEYAASKYISRWWKKHGPVKGLEDVEKAKHYVQKIKEAHAEGRYPTGFSRLRDVSMSAYKTMDFGKKNNLTEHESMICWMLAGWETPAALDECLSALDYITANPQKAAGGRGAGGAV